MAHLLWIKSVSANYPDNNYTVKTGRWLKLSRYNNCCIAKNLASLWASLQARRVDYSPSSSRSESPTARSQWRVVNIICLLQAIIKERLRSRFPLVLTSTGLSTDIVRRLLKRHIPSCLLQAVIKKRLRSHVASPFECAKLQ